MFERKDLEVLRAQLENERSSFISHWRDLVDHQLPRRGRFSITDTNKGDKKNTKIIDSTATLALRNLRSGMMSGITSPARPWFKLATPDPSLNEFQPVKDWLTFVADRMNTVFLRSNLYNVLPIVYGDIGSVGTACILMEEDSEHTIRFYPFPIGTYSLAQDHTLRTNTFFREFRMTVCQLVEQFAEYSPSGEIIWDNFSTYVKDMYQNGNKQVWIDLYHFIFPNKYFDQNKFSAKYKKYSSIYCERGTYSGAFNSLSDIYQNRFLRVSGYDFFPILSPRWEVASEDVYGTDCPGMTALGDIKQLQLGEKRAAQAVEKMINPPMTGPTSMKNSKASILPGDITYVDTKGNDSFRASHEVRFDLTPLENKQAQIRDRIRRCYFEDLFLMMANSDRRQITAREIEERHEEKLLALGPVLEQLNQDLLNPLIDNTFQIMVNQGQIPTPPEELQGMNLKVEYISIMAQAQKLVGIGALERTVGFVSQMAQLNPEALDKIDIDQTIDIYSDLTSVPPGVIRSDEVVASLRADRAKQQQMQQEQQQMQQQAVAAKQLSETNLEGKNALSEIVKRSEIGELV